MFENDTTNFENLVAGSETLQTKWTAVCEAVQNDIKDRYGVYVDESTVQKLGEVRLFTLSANATLDQISYSQQVESLPQLAEILRIRAIQSGDIIVRKAALEEVNAMPSGTLTSRSDKISAARRLNVATSGADYDSS